MTNSDQSALSTKPEVEKKSGGGRILELDAIRALTCMNLLLFHYTYVYQYKYDGFSGDLGFAFPYGKYGVQLFFMLSGLVNALTLIKKRKPGQFITSRCIRILPSYWLVILLNLFLFSTLAMFNHSIAVGETVANLTTMPGLFGFENMEPVTWTLQVEMLFYLFLMATFAMGWLDKPLRTLMVVIGICLATCTFFDWYLETYPDSTWNSTFHVLNELFILRNLPLFSMGILLNELRCGRGKPWQLWLGIGLSGVVFHLIDLREHNPVATVLMMGLLTAAAYGKIPILRLRPLVFISLISYPLYLFHNNLGTALMKFAESVGVPAIPTLVLATLVSIGLAALITYRFEQPLTNRLRKLFEKRRKAGNEDKVMAATQTATAAPTFASQTKTTDPQPGNAFDSSECLDEVIEAEELMREIRKDNPDEDALTKS